MRQIVFTEHFDEFKQRLDGACVDKMQKAVNVVRDATLETLSGTRSGRTYYVPGTHTTYTASAPGEAPASATGELRQSVKTEIASEGKMIMGAVGTDVDYGAILEFGSAGGTIIRSKSGKPLRFFVDGHWLSKWEVIQGPILPRPWLRPSFEKTEDKVKEIMGESIT